MKIAVVYNRESQKVINLFGQPNKERLGQQTLKRIADALRQGGHQVRTFEADKDLIGRLEEFMPRVIKGERPGMAFNVSYGIQGQARYTHVPSILEMVGIPYIASGPLAHSIALDKVVTKILLVQHGLPTPPFAVLDRPDFQSPDLSWPLIVKPKHEAVSFGVRIVNNEKELREAAGLIFEMFGQAVLAEHYIDGREISVGLLGNAPPETLPPVELTFGEGAKVYSYEDKTGRSGRTIGQVCPAPIGAELTARAQALARKTFAAVGCCDCARVDMRIDGEGKPYILEINSLPAMGPRASFVVAAQRAGLEFPALVNRLVEAASARYFGTPAPPKVTARTRDPQTAAFSFLTERRDRIERRLGDWIKRSSRTSDPTGLQNAVKELDRLLRDMAMRPVAELTGGQMVFTWESGVGLAGGTLLVGHLDVPLEQQVAHHPFRREPEWLWGEGIGTSRAPLVMMLFALRAMRSVRLLHKRRIGVLYYLDEGRDCRYSAKVIRAAMARAKRVLVLRPGSLGGVIIDQRRGQRKYRLRVEGKPVRPGKMRKQSEVLLWFGRKILDLASLSSREDRLSVSVAEVRTEAFPMLLPHRITATILETYADASRVDGIEQSVRDTLGLSGPRWELELVSDRPPMPQRRGNRALVRSLEAAAGRWDIPLKTESSVWPSVAGLAPVSTAAVCGVGPVATDLYTPQEAVQRISLIQRTLLLTQFLLEEEKGA